MKKFITKITTLLILIVFNNSFTFFAYSQTNIDSISGRFEQLSKQLSDLEIYVYNSGKKSNEVLSSSKLKKIDALENAVKELTGIIEVDLLLQTGILS